MGTHYYPLLGDKIPLKQNIIAVIHLNRFVFLNILLKRFHHRHICPHRLVHHHLHYKLSAVKDSVSGSCLDSTSNCKVSSLLSPKTTCIVDTVTIILSSPSSQPS